MTRLWKVAAGALFEVPAAKLQREADIEGWIAADPNVLGLDVLIIGRQVLTPYGTKIDLLGIDAEGELWIIECKRDRTPREVIAQVLDYASWVRTLTDREVHDIAAGHLKANLRVAFEARFGDALPEPVNVGHNMVVVATAFDEASHRIVQYLAEEHGVSINAAFFRFFEDGGQAFLASDWLLAVDEVQERRNAKIKAPWSGYFFVNVASSPHRDWEDNCTYSFVSAGGGRKWSDQLNRLQEGAPIYAHIPKHGYVGLGVVNGPAVPVAEFTLPNGKKLSEVALKQPSLLATQHDPEKTEDVVPVEWTKAVPLEQAIDVPGRFAKQHIVCRLSHPATLDYLAQHLGAITPATAGRE